VFNTAYKFVGRHEEAEDLTQEIFIKLYRSLRTFDRRANFQTWLISISRNLCIDRYRQKRKERETIDTNIDADELRPVSQELHPLFRVEQRDRVELLRAALATLPESLREPLIMHDLQELGYAQIAKTLRMPEGTAKSRINRARGELAAAIRKLRGDDYKPSEASTPSDTARLPGAFK
jgi:RNA polymerase sigma-70 factor (ECF subfamily)